MISASIKKLVEYGLEKGLIQKEDEIYTINRLLEVMGEQEYRQEDADNGKKGCWNMTAWYTGICLIQS